MPKQRMTQESAPPRTDRPRRQILVFLLSTYTIAVGIALALPHAGITPMLSIAAPILGFAVTMAVAVPRGQRRAVLKGVGFNPRRGRGLLVAVLGPVLIGTVSFSIAAAVGVVGFPGLGAGVSAASSTSWSARSSPRSSSSARRSAGAGICSSGWPRSPPGGRRPSSPAPSTPPSICRCCSSPPPTRVRVSAGSSSPW